MFNARTYWDERLKKHYNLVGVGDISQTMNFNKWSYKVTHKLLKRLFKKYCHGNKVLDIGSGTGFVVRTWKELNKQVQGVDISATAVQNLQKNFPEYSFMEFDIGSGLLPLPDNSFSACSAASVLYHIVDDQSLEKAIQNIHRVLEKDGIFIFSENFLHKGNFNIVHQKCRSLEEYETVLQKNGFEILNRLPNYVLFNDPVDAQSKFYPRIWNLNTKLSNKYKIYDAIIWPILYPVELFLTSIKKESPTQEFMICRALK